MRETSEVAQAARRMIRSVGNRLAEQDVEDLAMLDHLEAAVQLARADAIEGMRQHGITDREIGEQLGMTRQAVQQRWPRRHRVVGAGARHTMTYGDMARQADEALS